MSQKKNLEKIAEIMHRDCRLSVEQVATMLDMTPVEVAAAIDRLEKDGTILGYGAVVDWDKLEDAKDRVTAYIELKVTPQRNNGFDRLAERIYQYPEHPEC